MSILQFKNSKFNLPLTREGIVMWSIEHSVTDMCWLLDRMKRIVPGSVSSLIMVHEVLLWTTIVRQEFPDLHQIKRYDEHNPTMIYICGIPVVPANEYMLP